MAGEQPPPIVPLIQKQADGVAFAKAKLKLHAVFQDRELFGGRFPQRELW